MAIAQSPAFDEVLDFLVTSPTPEQIIAFRPSEATRERIHRLLDANSSRKLTEEENAELDDFGRAEHLVRMLKIKARKKLKEAEQS